MFNVVAVKAATVTNFGFRFNGGDGNDNPYEVYTMNSFGDYKSNMFVAEKWTKVDSGNTQSGIEGAMTATFEAEIPAGQTQAFYIAGTNRGLIAQMVESRENSYQQDDNVQLMVGNGMFPGAAFSSAYGDSLYVNPSWVTVYYVIPGTA
jgi:hypothetical protein